MISIITVVKNGASTIESTILSVINQDFKNFEYIIIDGISTDGTLDILDSYKDKINVIISEKDKGIYDAMNKGINLAKGEWVYFLGCDDILHHGSTLSQIFLNTDYTEYHAIYGNVFFCQSKIIFDGEFSTDKLALKSICQQSIFYRKELFEKFGLFNISYKTAADHVFNMNTFCHDPKRWLFKDLIVADYNERGTSATTFDHNYHNNCFEIKYTSFAGKVSNYTLTRIFYSSFYRFLKTHNVKISLKYILKIIHKIGLFSFTKNMMLIIKIKLLNREKSLKNGLYR